MNIFDLQRMGQMFQTKPLDTSKESSTVAFIAAPPLMSRDLLWILRFWITKQNCWLDGMLLKTEKEDEWQKAKQKGFALVFVCIGSMASLAMPVRMEFQSLFILSADRIICQKRQVREMSRVGCYSRPLNK